MLIYWFKTNDFSIIKLQRQFIANDDTFLYIYIYINEYIAIFWEAVKENYSRAILFPVFTYWFPQLLFLERESIVQFRYKSVAYNV